MNESLVKYLAGLLDADGSLSLEHHIGYDGRVRISLNLHLSSSDTVDRHGFVASLPDLTGMGRYNRYHDKYNQWFVGHRADLEMLLPRLIKHLVIKGKHWQWLLDFWRDWRSQAKGQKSMSMQEWESLQQTARESRITRVGPVRSKNHPTWAWVAGYLDGDGCYSLRTKRDKHIRISVTAHVNDVCGLEFLQKAFGGTIVTDSRSNNIKIWWRGLGPRDASFALRFLPKVVNHSRLKKHKIEQVIGFHRQRLSVPKAAA